MITNDISKICNKTIFCREQDCQQSHQRKFVGICLEYLKQESDDEDDQNYYKKKCSNPHCQLYHFDSIKMHLLLQMSSINGIWLYNLCPQKNCNFVQCQYLHKKWAQDVCMKFMLTGCKKLQCKKHIDWCKLREEVYKQYNVSEINPEKINQKQENKYIIHLKNQNLCIENLKGICPNLKCKQIHCDWEDIPYKSCFKQSVYPCTNQISQNNFIEAAQNIQIQQLCDKEKLIKLQREINQANIIDVIFILDLTLSMKHWLNTIKCEITNIIYQFKEKINGYGIRVGFVGYRDVCEAEDQIVCRCLTDNFEEITRFIQDQEAKGGGDQAEDVISGLKQGLKLNISLHPDSILCTFLIADAPCHGKQYHHEDISDDLQDQIEPQSLENIMKQYKQVKKLSFFTCFKIRDSTDLMFQKMQEGFPDLIITRKSQPSDFPQLVTFALESSISITLNQQDSPLRSQFLYTEANFIQPKIINYDISKRYQKKSQFWENFSVYVDENQRSGATALEIKLQPEITLANPQNEALRNTYVFQVFDAINNRYMVAKLSKEHVKKYRENELTENDIEIAEEQAKTRYYVAAYANELAFLFRQKTKEFDGIPPIFYVTPILYKLESPFYGVKQLYAETCINQAKFKWKKYTDYYFYSSFSHFTYTETEGTLVILDLQGSDNILTDASIQTLENKIPILEKDHTNQKQIGITIFLNQQHQQCSLICQMLKLSRKNFSIQNPEINKNLWQLQDHQMVLVICESCLQLRSYSLDQFKQMNEIKCDNCRDLQKQPIQSLCKCCLSLYPHDPNEDLQTLTVYGFCKICKSNCLQRASACIYCSNYCTLKLKQIGTFQKYICVIGYQYLQTLYCKDCQTKYQFQFILSEQDYKDGNFICCQKK
ncbi:unnamed protein product [Paramecium sonneborni]|uniref:Alpha-type protein kinase domain-containing protein n=1 Tax=Paramecium sonneborni TaxID=65129 RepID=A0A8S1L7R9_9CILI|nr:unnamed protein product [Paramecium sonneborni]